MVPIASFFQYWTKLEVAMTGNVGPDLFWINAPNLLKYISNDLILPITDIYTKEMKKNISEVPRKIYEQKGEIWGVPAFYDTIGIFYNKELFEKYDVPLPKNDWN